MGMNITEKLEELGAQRVQEMIDSSTNFCVFIKSLGFNDVYGGSRKRLMKFIEKHNLNRDRIEENIKNYKRSVMEREHNKNRIDLNDILSGKREYKNTYHLGQKLLEAGLKERKCECCGLTKWENEPIPLQLHHKDGDKKNNSLENLEFRCPNCHAMTETYCGKNTKAHKSNDCKTNKAERQRQYRARQKEKDLDFHNRTFEERSKSPGKDILKKELRKSSFLAIGNKYGVSDNAVRKWCDHYGLPRHSKTIKQMSDEDWAKL